MLRSYGKTPQSSDLLSKWRVVPKVHPELVLALVEFFHGSSLDGSILVFLPGVSQWSASCRQAKQNTWHKF